MTNHVQNYPAAASAYAAALKGLRTANADTAGTLLQNLKDAIAEYAALLDGTQYTVSAAATQNGSALTEPVITLTDAYGNVTTGTGSAKVIAGDYKFSVFSIRKVISSLAEKDLPEPGTPSRNADWFSRFSLLHMMRLWEMAFSPK